jgi:hypothetical protein
MVTKELSKRKVLHLRGSVLDEDWVARPLQVISL